MSEARPARTYKTEAQIVQALNESAPAVRPYFCRSKVAVPSATVAPTAGGAGSLAAVVPATVTMYLLPPLNCNSWPKVTAVVLDRAGRRSGLPRLSVVDVTARPR